ncbi:MAG: bifunctional adenosylcobinamide kinase/adenosylcobinamide-phosphate guanylyltransferase [Deltaproteobacteria bacterium]|nr:bifunctional adenosylcobinamide kinase/adenosylcobinamide-phosphate guanylyltransferase [Deltaproteobacteria bacterium]
MKESVFVIGGCRSGKSSYALKLAEEMYGNKRAFIATCVPHDEEMETRIERHKQERSPSWETLETPVQIAEIIDAYSPKYDVILVDCLTLWISNLLFDDNELEEVSGYIQRLTQSIKTAQCPVILVSNEVGTGIVPDNKIARFFRDVVGLANQHVAKTCDKVIWMAAGIPVTIKGGN